MAVGTIAAGLVLGGMSVTTNAEEQAWEASTIVDLDGDGKSDVTAGSEKSGEEAGKCHRRGRGRGRGKGKGCGKEGESCGEGVGCDKEGGRGRGRGYGKGHGRAHGKGRGHAECGGDREAAPTE